MATVLARLGRAAFRRWPLVLAAWLVVLLGLAAFSASAAKPLDDTFSIPGIPSERAATLQEQLFPDAPTAVEQTSLSVVLQAPEGSTLADPEWQRAAQQVAGRLATLPQVTEGTRVPDPVTAAQAQREQILAGAARSGLPRERAEADAETLSPLSPDGRTGMVAVGFDVADPTEVEPATRAAVQEVLDGARAAGFTAEANGTALTGAFEVDGTSELVGIGFALVVLLLTFGSAVAAGVPILTALVGVAIGILGILGATAFLEIGTTTPTLATMIGLAVGIDYALFILARYRSEREHLPAGVDPRAGREHAIGIAVGTAGSAVVFAGLTVVIALAALSVVGIPFLTSMGVAAAGTVVVAVLVALTLLPALLGMLGGRAFGGRVRRLRTRRDPEGRVVNGGVLWARGLGRFPVVAVLVAVVGLGAVAIPSSDLRLALPSDSTAPSDTTQRKASDLVTEAFGPGRESPLLLVVDARDVPALQRPLAFGAVLGWASGLDGIVNAQGVARSADGSGLQVLITPEEGPTSDGTKALLDDLRSQQGDIEVQTGTVLGVTGLAAVGVDVSERLADALPLYLALVIGLAFLLLLLVFRSVLVPLTATLGFLLSVLATLGAVVLVFQRGLFGLVEEQPLVSFMPVILVGVTFGLAMDYQVFLVTRMREAHVHGADHHEAVVDGFRNGARVVTAAALIMTSVFAAFMLIDEPIIASMGFALAAAVLFDAFVVRMVLVPALLHLLGERAWWLPGWLDRLLPEVDVEGERLIRDHPAPAEQGPARMA